MAAKASEFPGGVVTVGVSVPFMQGGLCVSKTAASRGYVARSGDGGRFEGIRSSDGMPLVSYSSGDGGTAVLNLLQSWETSGII